MKYIRNPMYQKSSNPRASRQKLFPECKYILTLSFNFIICIENYQNLGLVDSVAVEMHSRITNYEKGSKASDDIIQIDIKDDDE